MSVQVYTSPSFEFVKKPIEQMFANSLLDLEIQVTYDYQDTYWVPFPPYSPDWTPDISAHVRFLVSVSRKRDIRNENWPKKFLTSLRQKATQQLHVFIAPLQDRPDVVEAENVWQNAVLKEYNVLPCLSQNEYELYYQLLTRAGFTNTIFEQPHEALTQYLLFRELPDTDHFLIPFSTQTVDGLGNSTDIAQYVNTVLTQFSPKDRSCIIRHTKQALFHRQNNVMEMYLVQSHLLSKFHAVIPIDI